MDGSAHAAGHVPIVASLTKARNKKIAQWAWTLRL